MTYCSYQLVLHVEREMRGVFSLVALCPLTCPERERERDHGSVSDQPGAGCIDVWDFFFFDCLQPHSPGARWPLHFFFLQARPGLLFYSDSHSVHTGPLGRRENGPVDRQTQTTFKPYTVPSKIHRKKNDKKNLNCSIKKTSRIHRKKI